MDKPQKSISYWSLALALSFYGTFAAMVILAGLFWVKTHVVAWPFVLLGLALGVRGFLVMRAK